MSWSYNPNLSTDLDQVRFLIGDTDTTEQQLSNEELTWVLTQQANIYAAAAQACRNLQAHYARKATKSVGDLSIQWAELHDNYKELSIDLDRLAARYTTVPVPYAGGLSISDKQIEEADEDRVVPAFYVGVHNNPGQRPYPRTRYFYTT